MSKSPVGRTFSPREKLFIAISCGLFFFILGNPIFSIKTIFDGIINMPTELQLRTYTWEEVQAGAWMIPAVFAAGLGGTYVLRHVGSNLWPEKASLWRTLAIISTVMVVLLVLFVFALLASLAGVTWQTTFDISIYRGAIQAALGLVILAFGLSKGRRIWLAAQQIGLSWAIVYALAGFIGTGIISYVLLVIAISSGYEMSTITLSFAKITAEVPTFYHWIGRWFWWVIPAFALFMGITWNSDNFRTTRTGATNMTMNSEGNE